VGDAPYEGVDLASLQQALKEEVDGLDIEQRWQVTTITTWDQPGDVETLVPYVDGPSSSATIHDPVVLTYGQRTGSIYFTDVFYHTIRRLEPDGSTVHTHCGTPHYRAHEAMKAFGPWEWGRERPDEFTGPYGLCSDREENLYVGDSFNFRVPKITPDGKAYFFAGPLPHDGEPDPVDGPKWRGRFLSITGLDCDDYGNVYVVDALWRAIRKVCNDTDRHVVTLRNDMLRDDRPLKYVKHALLDTDGSILVSIYDGDPDRGDMYDFRHTWTQKTQDGHCIKRVTPDGQFFRWAGDGDRGWVDGSKSSARFDSPSQIAWGPDHTLYIADAGNNAIRAISPDGEVTTIAGCGPGKWGYNGDGPARGTRLFQPHGIAVDDDGNVYIGDTLNSRIRKVSPMAPPTWENAWQDAKVSHEQIFQEPSSGEDQDNKAL